MNLYFRLILVLFKSFLANTIHVHDVIALADEDVTVPIKHSKC